MLQHTGQWEKESKMSPTHKPTQVLVNQLINTETEHSIYYNIKVILSICNNATMI